MNWCVTWDLLRGGHRRDVYCSLWEKQEVQQPFGWDKMEEAAQLGTKSLENLGHMLWAYDICFAENVFLCVVWLALKQTSAVLLLYPVLISFLYTLENVVLCISGTLTCGNFERIHYLPNHKLGFVFTPLPQVLFWFVCMPVFVSH